MNKPVECVFCRIIAGEEPADVVYQDDEVIVFRDHRPRAPVHLLICPKKHYPDFLSAPVEVHRMLCDTVKKVAQLEGVKAGQFRLVINNGAHWGQIVFHLHYHFMAGER